MYRSRIDSGTATSDLLRHYFDRTAGTLGDAHAATLAVIVFELKPLARPQFGDRVVRTDAVAVVALKTVAAGHAAARLEQGVLLVEIADHLGKTALPADHFEGWPDGARRIRVVPGIEHIVGYHLMLGGDRVLLAPQPGVDIARRLLAMADGGAETRSRRCVAGRRRRRRKRAPRQSLRAARLSKFKAPLISGRFFVGVRFYGRAGGGTA